MSNDAVATRFLMRVLIVLGVCTLAAVFTFESGWWFLWPLNWLATGTALFGLFEIAHNCGHRAFFTSRRTNTIVGHLATIPLLYPFTQWKLWHDAHHRRPNTTAQTLYDQFQGEMELGHDTAFTPMARDEAERARRAGGGSWIVYIASRAFTPVAVFLAPYLLSVRFARQLRPQDKRACRRSLVFTMIAVPTCMFGVWWATGTLWALLHFWILPLAIYACWLGYYSLLQHTGESIPVFRDEEWDTRAQYMAVVNTRTPRLVSWLHGGGEFHAIHHVAPTIPNYHLPQAYEALKASDYADSIRDVRFSLLDFVRVQRSCQVWDHERQAYRTISSLDERVEP